MSVRMLPMVLLAAMAGAGSATADPELIVRYPNGVPQVSIAGDYSGASYTVYRAPAGGGSFQPIGGSSILCLGPCYVEDRSAMPGESYRYRFDLVTPNGEAARFVSYGPYLATISPALARPLGIQAYPNPGRGATSVLVHLAGSPGERGAEGEAAIFDLAGRRVRVLYRGTVARGVTTLAWDGRDERGETLKAGVYLLRLVAEGRSANTLLVRR